MTDGLSERLHAEAVARITWGDLPEEVAESLAAQGMDYSAAVRRVNQLVTERNAEVRERCRRRLIKGSVALLAAVVFFAFLPWKEWYDGLRQLEYEWGWRRKRRGWSDMGSLMVAAAIGLGVAGLWNVWRGFWGLLTPQLEELSDVE